jgi:uncharacterized protein YegL
MTAELRKVKEMVARKHGGDPEPELLCVVGFDTSGSMGEGVPESRYHNKITELNEAVSALPKEILKDELAARRVRIAGITFGGEVKVVQSFVPADRFQLPKFQAKGHTPMAEAILRAIDYAEEGQAQAEKRDLDTYGPWILFVTDGQPTDSAEMLEKARQRIHEVDCRERGTKRIAFFAVGVEGADMEKLNWLSKRPALKLQGLDYARMFRWLAHSLTQVSMSQPGQSVQVPHPKVYDLEM